MGDVASNRIRSTTSNYTAPINNRSWWQASPMYLDSPSTTSAVAYSFKWRGESTATQYLNRTAYDGDEGGSDGVTSYDPRTASSITVWEVLA